MAGDGRRTGSTERRDESRFPHCLSVCRQSQRGPASQKLFPCSPPTWVLKLTTCLHREENTAHSRQASTGLRRGEVGGGWWMARGWDMLNKYVLTEGRGGEGRGRKRWTEEQTCVRLPVTSSENMKMTAIRGAPGPSKWTANDTARNLGRRWSLISCSLCSWNRLSL